MVISWSIGDTHIQERGIENWHNIQCVMKADEKKKKYVCNLWLI